MYFLCHDRTIRWYSLIYLQLRLENRLNTRLVQVYRYPVLQKEIHRSSCQALYFVGHRLYFPMKQTSISLLQTVTELPQGIITTAA